MGGAGHVDVLLIEDHSTSGAYGLHLSWMSATVPDKYSCIGRRTITGPIHYKYHVYGTEGNNHFSSYKTFQGEYLW